MYLISQSFLFESYILQQSYQTMWANQMNQSNDIISQNMVHKKTKNKSKYLIYQTQPFVIFFLERLLLLWLLRLSSGNDSLKYQINTFGIEMKNLNNAINNHTSFLLFSLFLQSCQYTTSTVGLAGDLTRLCATGNMTTRWI